MATGRAQVDFHIVYARIEQGWKIAAWVGMRRHGPVEVPIGLVIGGGLKQQPDALDVEMANHQRVPWQRPKYQRPWGDFRVDLGDLQHPRLAAARSIVNNEAAQLHPDGGPEMNAHRRDGDGTAKRQRGVARDNRCDIEWTSQTQRGDGK